MVYAEGGHYTPLLQRARDLWRELEAAGDAELLTTTGVVTIMDNDHPDHAALLRAGRERGLSFEVLAGPEARRRLPQHVIHDGDVALLDPEGGFVRSERAVFSAVRQAERRGALFLGNRQVRALERQGDRWLVRTDPEEIRAPRVLVATGTGAGPVCEALGTHLAVLPQILTWFPIADHDLLARGEQQVFIRSSRDAQFYGFPSSDGWTMKVAASIYLDEVASMARPVTWDPGHLDTVQSWVSTYLPALVPRPARAVLCAAVLENPGRVHPTRVRNLGLAAEQDAGFADDDRGVPADEAEAELLVAGRAVLERPLEGQGHALADHVTAVAERAGHDGGRVRGVVGDQAGGVAGLPRLVGVNQYGLDGGRIGRATV
jgi:glycine/D-amino acid oxidase-like deaminating enzyme